MLYLSTRAKEAIKTGLAVTIVYWVALSFDWLNPHWAVIAVAMVSLPTAGQSLNKGVLRLLGTIIGAAAALLFLALFPQERWAFMACVSIYVGACTYLMTGKKRQYFWQVSGFVCLIVAVAGIGSGVPFTQAVVRVLETGLGIVVYTLVSIFLWPQTSASALQGVSRELMSTQRKLLNVILNPTADGEVKGVLGGLAAQQIQLIGRLEQVLQAAASERYEIQQARPLWERLLHLSTELMEAFDGWREGIQDTQSIDLRESIPNLDSIGALLDRRFAQIDAALEGATSYAAPTAIEVTFDETKLRGRSHLERAAVFANKTRLERLDRLTGCLLDCVADLQDFGSRMAPHDSEPVARSGWAVDPDRIQAVVMVMASFWIGFVLWVYLNPPGHAGFVTLVPTVAMAIAITPQLKASSLLYAFAFGSIVAGIVYVLIMPHLSGFLELGLMIFCVWFLIYFVFWKPQQIVTRLGCAVAIVVMVKIDNEQTYSFAGYANSVAFILLGTLLLIACTYIPVSPRPEKAFLRLLARYFRGCELVVSSMAYEAPRPDVGAARWNVTYHRRGIMELPQKLAAWSRFLDYRVLPGTAADHVQKLVVSLQGLAYRLKEAIEVRNLQESSLLRLELADELHDWRVGIEETFHRLVGNVDSLSPSETRQRLEATLASLEERINESLEVHKGSITNRDVATFYDILGAYRGVSHAIIDCVGHADSIDWSKWQEPRF